MEIEKNNADQALQAGYYLIELLSAVLDQRTPKRKPDGVELEQIYRMSKRHCVDVMALRGVELSSEVLPNALDQKWQIRQTQSALQSLIQAEEKNNIIQEFVARGIKVLPLKGCIMKGLYPKDEYRQMSDLDFLIDPEMEVQARDVMNNLGYETKRWKKDHHDSYLKKPWMNVELHIDLPSIEGFSHKGYFDNIWDRVIDDETRKGVYKMTWEDFYIFMVQHLARHFYYSGIGIRFIMDIYIFLKEKRQVLDFVYLNRELDKLNLRKFNEDIVKIAKKWFGAVATDTYTDIEEMIILSGVYGTSNQRDMRTLEKLSTKYHSAGLAKIVHISRWIFPEYGFMCNQYSFLERMPILLPFFWLHRGVGGVIHKKSIIKNKFLYIMKFGKDKS